MYCITESLKIKLWLPLKSVYDRAYLVKKWASMLHVLSFDLPRLLYWWNDITSPVKWYFYFVLMIYHNPYELKREK